MMNSWLQLLRSDTHCDMDLFVFRAYSLTTSFVFAPTSVGAAAAGRSWSKGCVLLLLLVIIFLTCEGLKKIPDAVYHEMYHSF